MAVSVDEEESILTKSMRELLYEESQGIIDIICKIIVMAQTIAISTGKEQVDEKLMTTSSKRTSPIG